MATSCPTELFSQIPSLMGAAFVLFAYIGHQTNKIRSDSIVYNVCNLLGSGVLTYVALFPLQIGFVIAEGTWFGMSLLSLYKLIRKRNQSRKTD